MRQLAQLTSQLIGRAVKPRRNPGVRGILFFSLVRKKSHNENKYPYLSLQCHRWCLLSCKQVASRLLARGFVRIVAFHWQRHVQVMLVHGAESRR